MEMKTRDFYLLKILFSVQVVGNIKN